MKKINTILRKLAIPAIDKLPPQENELHGNPVYKLLDSNMRNWSALYWLSIFMNFLAMYFVFSWTPKIIVDAGFSLENSVSVGLLLNLGSILGILSLGYLSSRFGLRKILVIYMLAGAITSAIFIGMSFNLTALLVIAFTEGFFIVGSMVGHFIVAVWLYPSSLRARALELEWVWDASAPL